jgi:hypothetical protein
MSYIQAYLTYSRFFETLLLLLLADHIWLPKITTEPHILFHTNILFPSDMYPKLDSYVSELFGW